MADIPKTIDTPAGSLKVGSRYDLVLSKGSHEPKGLRLDGSYDLPNGDYSDEELKGAKIVAFEHTDIGVPGGGMKPGDIIPSEVQVHYQAETADRTVGFLADNVVKAVPA